MADEPTEATHHPGEELLRVAEVVHAGEVSVTFEPGPTVLAKVGDKLLDIAEASQVPIESGCRMGMCGSDPVRVLEGGDNLSAVTAADELRRVLPDTELLLVGAEPYDFYNRMAITRLVSESASIDSLYLNRRDWAESRRVDFRRGVPATEIDRQNREVAIADGERLEYDRVVIATGARPLVPALEGFGADGSFVLRTIDDAVQIQQYIRRTRCRTAVIVGAGLLGLEAAYNIAQLDVRVRVLDRGRWPLRRQLDEQAGALVWEMLLDVGVGITVDGGMRTSDPDIFAVGDVAEHDGRPYGLWPASVEQAQVAAANVAGGEVVFAHVAPPARLKVPGIDLLSIGAVDAERGESRTVVVSAYGTRNYRKLILEHGRLTGAIILGSPELFDDVTRAVETQLPVGSELDALEKGKWEALSQAVDDETLAD